MKKIILGAIIFVMVFFVGIFSTRAQVIGGNEKLKSCVDYFPSGGMVVSSIIVAEKKAFSAGETVKIKLDVKNQSTVEIPDGAVLIRVEKREFFPEIGSNKGVADQKTIDEFFYPDNIVLGPKEEKMLETDWVVPVGAEYGKYVVNVFPLHGRNVNISLSSFNSLERASKENEYDFFTIQKAAINGVQSTEQKIINAGENANDKNGRVTFDEAKIKVDGNAYDGTGLDFQNKNALKITGEISNLSAVEKGFLVEQTLYNGNYFSGINSLDSQREIIQVGPGATKEISYSLNKFNERMTFPYYLRTVISYGENKIISTTPLFSKASFIGFVPTLNYLPFLDKVPTKKGEGAKLIVCVNNPLNQGGLKLTATLKNEKGEGVAKIEKDLTSQINLMNPLTTDFKLNGDSSYLQLEVSVADSKGVVDSYQTAYDRRKGEASKTSGAFSWNNLFKTILYIFAIFVIIFALIMLIKKRKNGKIFGLLLFGLVFGSLMFGNPAKAAPTQVQVSQYGVGITYDGTGVGYDCGLPFMHGLSAMEVPYQLGVEGGSLSGSNLTITKDDGVAFSLGSGITRDLNGTPFNFNDDSFNVNTWGKTSAFWQPFKYINQSVGFGNGSLALLRIFGQGRINATAPAVGFALGSTQDGGGMLIGAGLVSVFAFPHHFPNIADGSIVQNEDDCDSFDLTECKSSCCTSCGCTNGTCPGLGCAGDGKIWNGQFQQCLNSCDKAKNICNNIANEKNSSPFKDTFLGKVRAKINNISIPDSVSIVSSDNNIISCDSVNATCTAKAAGSAKIYVTLPARKFLIAEFPLWSYGTGMYSKCTANPIPNPGIGSMLAVTKTFNVTVQAQTPTNCTSEFLMQGSCVTGATVGRCSGGSIKESFTPIGNQWKINYADSGQCPGYWPFSYTPNLVLSDATIDWTGGGWNYLASQHRYDYAHRIADCGENVYAYGHCPNRTLTINNQCHAAGADVSSFYYPESAGLTCPPGQTCSKSGGAFVAFSNWNFLAQCPAGRTCTFSGCDAISQDEMLGIVYSSAVQPPSPVKDVLNNLSNVLRNAGGVVFTVKYGGTSGTDSAGAASVTDLLREKVDSQTYNVSSEMTANDCLSSCMSIKGYSSSEFIGLSGECLAGKKKAACEMDKVICSNVDCFGVGATNSLSVMISKVNSRDYAMGSSLQLPSPINLTKAMVDAVAAYNAGGKVSLTDVTIESKQVYSTGSGFVGFYELLAKGAKIRLYGDKDGLDAFLGKLDASKYKLVAPVTPPATPSTSYLGYSAVIQSNAPVSPQFCSVNLVDNRTITYNCPENPSCSCSWVPVNCASTDCNVPQTYVCSGSCACSVDAGGKCDGQTKPTNTCNDGCSPGGSGHGPGWVEDQPK